VVVRHSSDPLTPAINLKSRTIAPIKPGLREDLNKFSPGEKKMEISSIFKWFKQDFEKAGGVPKILGRYALPAVREFAASGKYEIKYLPYNWGLNDQGPHGRNYSRADLFFDNIFK